MQLQRLMNCLLDYSIRGRNEKTSPISQKIIYENNMSIPFFKNYKINAKLNNKIIPSQINKCDHAYFYRDFSKEIERDELRNFTVNNKELMRKDLPKLPYTKKHKSLKKIESDLPHRNKYLYELMEERYIKNVKLPELENMERCLAQRKLSQRQVTINELLEHQKKSRKLRLMHINERFREELESMQTYKEYMMKVNTDYTNNYREQVLARDRIKRKEKALPGMRKRINLEKKLLYEQIIDGDSLFNYEGKLSIIRKFKQKRRWI